MSYEIAKMLIASTTHVTEAEQEVLNQHGYSRGEFGWLIYVDPSVIPVISEIPSPSAGLVGAIRIAQECG